MSSGNKRKPLVSILQFIGLIFTLISVFSGTMYITKGDFIISLFVSLIFVILSFFLIEQMIKRKEIISKKKISGLSILLWLLFLIITTPASLITYHFINVEINAKQEVINITNEKIDQLDEMLVEYDKKTAEYISNYEYNLEEDFSNYESEFISKDEIEEKYNGELDGIVDEIANGITSIEDIVGNKEMKFDGIKNDVENNNKTFLSNYKDVFVNWSRLEINTAFYELDKVLKENYDMLKEFYDKTANDSNFIFEYEVNISTVPMHDPILLFKKYKPYELSVFVFLFILLMILPFFMVKTPEYIKKRKAKSNPNTGEGPASLGTKI